jgi:hypothetical protein
MQHRVILLNFTERQAQHIAKAGFNVERGFIGAFQKEGVVWPFYAPHPLYEYDILIYNSDLASAVQADFSWVDLWKQRGSLSAISSFKTRPYLRVSFIGEDMGTASLMHGGVPFVTLERADANISQFTEYAPGTFSVNELHALITGFKTHISRVSLFFTAVDNYPFYHSWVLGSRGGGQIAGYGTTYDSARTMVRYVVLPQLKDITRAAIQLLECFETVFPELFPDKIKRDWLSSNEFLLTEERQVTEAVKAKVAETTAFIAARKVEQESLAKANAFIRQLLVATEDPKLELGHRLSGVVKRVLEFFEFEVVDIDQKIKSAIKKEDFWVMDGDFVAITEVTGTANKNPKVKEYNDILGRMTTIYRRKGELVLPAGANVSGLLVLNYDIDNHPAKRPRPYTGEDEHIAEAAVEQGIGILSTFELHKIIVAVKEGVITKNEARDILKKPGRIEFDTDYKKHQQAFRESEALAEATRVPRTEAESGEKETN